MRGNKSDPSFVISYLSAMAFQAPVWLAGGLFWAAFMTVLAGSDLLSSLLGGLGWGFFMWVTAGNLFAVLGAWRRSTELPAPDRAAFRAALEKARRKLGLVVLTESSDDVVLGPKWTPIRLRLQHVRIAFGGGAAKLSAPGLSFGLIRRAISRALDEAPSLSEDAHRGEQQAAASGSTAEPPVA